MRGKSAKRSDIITSLLILLFLLLYFGHFIQATGWDLVQHFMLVDELMKHGSVRPGALDRIGIMALYPPAAHWMAATIGWIGGSGLVGITITTIIATYGCYLVITAFLGSKSSFATILFTGLFFLISGTNALIGGEVIGNFLYPQLVADLAYLCALLLISKSPSDGTKALIALGLGLGTMWIQPLIAIHILAFGCVLMTVQALDGLRSRQSRIPLQLFILGFMVFGSAAIVTLHPALTIMRLVSGSDGTLEFGLRHIYPLSGLLVFVGIFNVWRYLKERTDFVDAVIGCALIAAVGLAFLQFSVWKFLGEGSAYAVKKHFFIIVTLGAIGVVRAIAGASFVKERTTFDVPFINPVAAGIMSFAILSHFNAPVRPFIDALNYANHAARYQLADFVPGNTVYDNHTRPLIENVMVSVTAFEHPFDKTASSWQTGAPIKDGAQFVMVARTPELEAQCRDRAAEGSAFMVIRPACLKRYQLGQTLTFSSGGNGWAYTGDGWSVPSAAGTWTLGDIGAKLTLELADPGRSANYRLAVDGLAYLGKEHPIQVVEVEVNGTKVAEWRFDLEHPAGRKTADIPGSLLT
ncbi:MAG: hypothetical protein Q7U74_10690, partial [Saprospiraceae bacterium]|nr:hypothetical protein [Saprospiraceae bacterium]